MGEGPGERVRAREPVLAHTLSPTPLPRAGEGVFEDLAAGLNISALY